MNIEIVKFYPKEKNERKDILKGSLHITFPDIGLDIRGVRISKKGKSWFLMLPGGKGVDKITKNPVLFPFLSFQDPEKQKKLINDIKKLAIPYIEALIRDTANPLVFPPSFASNKKHFKKPGVEKKPTSDYKNSKTKLSPRPPMPMSGWVDPPKKSSFARKKSIFKP